MDCKIITYEKYNEPITSTTPNEYAKCYSTDACFLQKNLLQNE